MKFSLDDLKSLLNYVSGDTRIEAIEALIKTDGNKKKAARIIGISPSSLRGRIDRIIHHAAKSGWEPNYGTGAKVPDGYRIKGTSTLVDRRSGEEVLKWIKTTSDDEKREEQVKQIIAGMIEDAVPKYQPASKPEKTIADMANLYVLSDVHIAMLAWHREGGADWDISIAERTVFNVFQRMIEDSPNSSHGIVCNLGDWVHSDGYIPMTPTSGHVLDHDSRFGKMIETSTRLMRMIVDMALAKHDSVHLIISQGNHDITSSFHLRNAFMWAYENEPRLTIDDSMTPFYVYQFGDVMLGFHHGHKVKPEKLPILFASHYPEIWGRTKRRYAHCGHRHHYVEREFSGIQVTQHPTIAARDAYAAYHGYLSERRAIATIYHGVTGKCGTIEITPEMV